MSTALSAPVNAASNAIDFKTLFESAPGLYLVLDPQLRIVAVSDAYTRATMTRREEILGKGIFEVFPDNPNDSAATGVRNLAASLNRVLLQRSGDTLPVQKYDIRKPDAEGGGFEERYWNPFNSPVLAADGTVAYIIHRVEDVSEFVRLKQQGVEQSRLDESLQEQAMRMEAETCARASEVATAEKIRGSERRYRELIDGLPVALYTTDRDGYLTLYNEAAATLWRRRPVLGKERWCGFSKLYKADGTSIALRRSPMAITIQENRSLPSGEITAERPDGTRVTCTTHPVPFRDAAGNLVGAMNVLVDITERKQAEEGLSQLAALVESSDDAIIGKTLDGIIVTWNAGAERIYGYSAAEVAGRSIAILVSPDHPDELPAILDKIKHGKRLDHFETVRIRKDGRRIDVSLTVSPIKDARGKVIGASAIARDVTARKRATEEIRAMTQQLWQAAKLASVGELAASIAHELNNPLATVSLRIEEMLGRTPVDDPRRRALEIVEQEVERMGDLVTNLLQFSRRGMEQISTVDVRDELTKAVDLIHHLLRKRLITVTLEMSPDTPTIYADRQKLRQVFLNLATNASDAMPGGGTLTLRTAPVTLPDGKPGVRIEFADTGEGIPAENLTRIMEPFFTTKEEGQGTGLGLPICRRIVEEHHGTLQVASEVGKGTTIRIVLPVRNGANVDRLDDTCPTRRPNNDEKQTCERLPKSRKRKNAGKGSANALLSQVRSTATSRDALHLIAEVAAPDNRRRMEEPATRARHLRPAIGDKHAAPGDIIPLHRPRFSICFQLLCRVFRNVVYATGNCRCCGSASARRQPAA